MVQPLVDAGVDEEKRETPRRLMPNCRPFTFTHGDLAICSILVKNKRLAGIIDFELAGFWPVWWEFAEFGIAFTEEDFRFKELLSKDFYVSALGFQLVLALIWLVSHCFSISAIP
jgi:thiamine kinase-like enzyme